MKRQNIIAITITAAVFFLIGFRFGKPNDNIDSYLFSFPLLNQNYIAESQYKIDVLKYEISLDLFPEEKRLIGDVNVIGIISDSTLAQIDLNFYDNFEIEGVWLNTVETPFINSKTRLSIPFTGSLKDTFNIRVKYSGTPVRAGLTGFAFGALNKKSVVYTLNEPNYASSWYPCNDMPSDKALLKMSITNKSDKTSLSNGKLISVSEKEGRKTFVWETVYPISTYLIAVYSAQYENFRDKYISRDGQDTMYIEYYAFPHHVEQAKIDFLDHPDMMEFFSELFGEYPFIKEKYGVAEFLWQIGAMENQTITGIGSNFIGGNKFFNDIYVHELAHSWWGNAVGPSTWKDIWLNEGFATYSEALYSEHLAGDDALRSTMMSKFDEVFKGRLYEPGQDLFSNTIYSKGAWVLHMLRWETGDSLFFKILKEYYNEYKYKTASTKDFQKLVETISGRDFSWFFNQWVLEGEDQINLNYNWNYDKDTVNLNLRQVQSQYPVYKFTLEVEIKYPDTSETQVLNIYQKESRFTLPVKTKPKSIVLDPKNRLLANYREKSF